MTQQRIDTAKEPKKTEPAKKKKSRKAKEPNPASSDGPTPSASSASSSTSSSASPARSPASKPNGFEAELRRLEETVADLEQGDLPLEDALGLYERGVALTRQLQQTLADAEQKVKILSEDGKDDSDE